MILIYTIIINYMSMSMKNIAVKLSIFALLLIVNFSGKANATQLFPKVIWSFWDQGENNMGQLGKAVILNSKLINKNWTLHILSDANLKQFFNETEMNQLNEIRKYTGIKEIPKSRSYFIRLALLKKYGGVWIDIHLVLLQSLDWIQNLQQNEQVINRVNGPPQAFLFHKAQNVLLGRLNEIKQKQSVLYPTIEIQVMLIAAVKGSKYIEDLYTELKLLHKQGKDHYNKLKTDLFLFREYFDYQPTLNYANHIIQHRQYRAHQANIKANKTNQIKPLYKVWAINRMKGVYFIPKQKKVDHFFKDLNYLSYQPKYAVKLGSSERSQLGKFLKNDTYQKDLLMRSYVNPWLFDLGQYYLPDQYSCLYKSYLDENSFLNKYMIQPIRNRQNVSLSVQTLTVHHQIPWICKKTTIYQLYDNLKNIQAFLYIPFYLIVFVEFLIQITLSLKRLNIQLKDENINQFNKQKVKQAIYYIGLLAYVLILQYYMIYAEVFMWYYESPYSWILFLISLAVISFMLSYFRIVEIKVIKNKINLEIFVILVILALWIQLLLIQSLSVWNFNGTLYHFEYLSDANKVNNREILRGFRKIVLMYAIAKLYFGAKIYYSNHKQSIYAKLDQFVQPIKREFSLKLKQKMRSFLKNDVRMEQVNQQSSNFMEKDKDTSTSLRAEQNI